MMLPRKPIRDISYAYRQHGYSSKDLRRLAKLKKIIFYTKMIQVRATSDASKAAWNFRLGLITHKYYHLHHRIFGKKTTRVNRVIENARTIDSFSDNSFWKRFRTRKEDLPKLLKAFQLELPPGQYFRSNDKARVKFTGEEVLLIGLHRYIVPGQLEHTMGDIFNLDYSMLSRAITIFNRHMLTCHEHLLHDNLEFWKPWFPYFAQAISNKLGEVGNIHYPVGSFRIVMFHDDTVIARNLAGFFTNGAIF